MNATLSQVMRELKKSQKNCEKLNKLNFLRQNHGLCQNMSPSVATIARWQWDNFKKKSRHQRKQKITRVAAALVSCSYINLLVDQQCDNIK